jgi:hypothetical protein
LHDATTDISCTLYPQAELVRLLTTFYASSLSAPEAASVPATKACRQGSARGLHMRAAWGRATSDLRPCFLSIRCLQNSLEEEKRKNKKHCPYSNVMQLFLQGDTDDAVEGHQITLF